MTFKNKVHSYLHNNIINACQETLYKGMSDENIDVYSTYWNHKYFKIFESNIKHKFDELWARVLPWMISKTKYLVNIAEIC